VRPAAEKALRKGNQEAATILQGAESLLSNADDDEKPSFSL
jgi:hypothetical protein